MGQTGFFRGVGERDPQGRHRSGGDVDSVTVAHGSDELDVVIHLVAPSPLPLKKDPNALGVWRLLPVRDAERARQFELLQRFFDRALSSANPKQ